MKPTNSTSSERTFASTTSTSFDSTDFNQQAEKYLSKCSFIFNLVYFFFIYLPSRLILPFYRLEPRTPGKDPPPFQLANGRPPYLHHRCVSSCQLSPAA